MREMALLLPLLKRRVLESRQLQSDSRAPALDVKLT